MRLLLLFTVDSDLLVLLSEEFLFTLSPEVEPELLFALPVEDEFLFVLSFTVPDDLRDVFDLSAEVLTRLSPDLREVP